LNEKPLDELLGLSELNNGFIADVARRNGLTVDQLNDVRRHLPDTQNLNDADFARLLSEKPLDELLGLPELNNAFITDVARRNGLTVDQLNDVRRHLPDTQNLSDASFARVLGEKPLDELLGLSELNMEFLRNQTGMSADEIARHLQQNGTDINSINGMNVEGLVGGLNNKPRQNFRTFDNHDEAFDWGSKSNDEWLSSLTPDQEAALNFYTGNDYGSINEFLRKGVDTGIDQNVIRHMQEALDTSIVPDNITVFRGTDTTPIESVIAIDELGNLDPNSLVGHTIVDPAFTSTSLIQDEAFGGGVLWEVLVPEGSNAGFLDPISQLPGELELLFNTGQGLHILEASINPSGDIHLIVEALRR